MKPEFTLLVGLPAYGKSSFVQELEQNSIMETAVVVCPDQIRMNIFGVEFNKDFEGMVWFATRTMVKTLLLQNRDVILDATNLSPLRRKEWIELGHDCNATVIAHYFDTPFEECVKRNNKRDRVVPEDVMERMKNELEPPTVEEGFDEVLTTNDEELNIKRSLKSEEPVV
jgi:predicted kinase